MLFITKKNEAIDSSYLYSRYTQKLDFVCKEKSRLSDSFLLQSIHEKIDKKYKVGETFGVSY